LPTPYAPDRPIYDATFGYGSIETLNPDKARNTILIAKTLVETFISIHSDDAALVAGCGDGTEAALICEIFNAKTVGVDLSLQGDLTLRNGRLRLLHADLLALPFSDAAFSLVYSYHSLEHVSDHTRALAEMTRVLKPGGVLLIGFPNKHRLVGYLGAQYDVTTYEKVLWNLSDYTWRIRGRFENKFGAHAGFGQNEFIRETQHLFSTVIPVRTAYMRLKYSRHTKVLDAITRFSLDEYLFPSNYFICTK